MALTTELVGNGRRGKGQVRFDCGRVRSEQSDSREPQITTHPVQFQLLASRFQVVEEVLP